MVDEERRAAIICVWWGMHASCMQVELNNGSLSWVGLELLDLEVVVQSLDHLTKTKPTTHFEIFDKEESNLLLLSLNCLTQESLSHVRIFISFFS